MTGLLSNIPANLPTAAVSTGEVLLPLLVIVPVLGAVVVGLIRDGSLARTAGLGVAVATFVLAVLLAMKIDGPQIGAAFAWNAPAFLSLESAGGAGKSPFQFSFAADAISVWLVALTAILIPCAMLATRTDVDRPNAYFAWLLVLEAACFGAFLASDLLLFYVFFELTLVPSFFLIGQWGGVERRRAAIKFFLYTFAGSLFMLASILYVGIRAGFNIADCAAYVAEATARERFWILLGLLAGLGVKVPLVPLHTWLPITYANAPAPVTALLTGVLAKLGTYGLLRLAVPIGGLGSADEITPVVVALATVAIIYAALVSWVQRDFKLLLAYSSISHLGFCVLALCTGTTLGGQAAVLYMVNHGIVAAALFFMLGMIEDRTGSRSLDQVGGLGKDRPRMAFFFVLFVMSAVGLPLTNGFVSEFLSLQSTVGRLPMTVTVLASTGIVLGAIYMLYLTGKLFFGPARQPATVTGPIPDLSGREMLPLGLLAALVLFLGVRPNVILRTIEPPVAGIMNPSASASTRDLANRVNESSPPSILSPASPGDEQRRTMTPSRQLPPTND